jgi:rubrerythrin
MPQAQEPINFGKIKPVYIDRQILRFAIMAELDAVSLYEQLAAQTDNLKLRQTFLDVAKEEKVHAGEFQAMLFEFDPEYATELEKGAQEVHEKLKRK